MIQKLNQGNIGEGGKIKGFAFYMRSSLQLEPYWNKVGFEVAVLMVFWDYSIPSDLIE